MTEVNQYFLKKLSESSISFGSKSFDLMLKKAEELTRLGIDSDDKAKKYKLLRNASKSLGINNSESFYKNALNQNVLNKNDAFYYVINEEINSKKIKKVAYPNSFNYNYDIKDEVDISKWLKTVHLIYDSVNKGEMTKQNALDYYSNFMNISGDEDVRFKRWFKYYSEGEHLKYASNQETDMKKKAIYMSNMGQSAGTYTQGGGSSYLGSGGGFNMPGDSFDGDTFDAAAKNSKIKSDESEAFTSWKSKLHAALRRIDKLLRSKHMSGEQYKVLAEHLLNLSHQVHCLKLASTINDVTLKTAGAMEKHGEQEAAEMLVKIAQQIPEEAAAPAPEEAAAPAPEEAAAPAPEEAPDPNDPKNAIPSGDDVEPASLKDITPIPGARQGEYEELAGTVSLDDAASKLDEVAGMLADRRIIRQLAEFDIMLDKIGIASMFPELAESQSKLIDAFSYALTRVTKMMGQLANAKSIIDSRNDLPGRDAQEEAAPGDAPAETEQE